jgi:hypothetical protein
LFLLPGPDRTALCAGQPFSLLGRSIAHRNGRVAWVGGSGALVAETLAWRDLRFGHKQSIIHCLVDLGSERPRFVSGCQHMKEICECPNVRGNQRSDAVSESTVSVNV